MGRAPPVVKEHEHSSTACLCVFQHGPRERDKAYWILSLSILFLPHFHHGYILSLGVSDWGEIRDKPTFWQTHWQLGYGNRKQCCEATEPPWIPNRRGGGLTVCFGKLMLPKLSRIPTSKGIHMSTQCLTVGPKRLLQVPVDNPSFHKRQTLKFQNGYAVTATMGAQGGTTAPPPPAHLPLPFSPRLPHTDTTSGKASTGKPKWLEFENKVRGPG
jgi:hypothetical protein